MADKFKAEVNGNHTFQFSQEEIDSLDIVEIENNLVHVIDKNKSISAKISASQLNNKIYKVKLHKKEFNIKIINKLDLLIGDLGFTISDGKDIDTIHAPMPGLVLDIMIKVGDEVSENDPLLILEAMKMENVISSPRNGKIKSINVSKEASVNKNDLLIEFE